MTQTSTTRIAAVVAEAARRINVPQSLQERLAAIVPVALSAVPGFDHASLSMADHNGQVRTRSASSGLVEKLDLYQYKTNEGPCLEALRGSGLVLVPSVRDEARWPRYIARAAEAGITAQMAVHLRDDAGVRGALNLYRTTGDGIDPEAPDLAALFAAHVAVALGRAHTEEQLNTAMETRKMIGQALGILMERYKIDEVRAFGFLTRASQNSNFKLRDIAREIVTQANTRYSAEDA
ncbi:GAF and ANTAR domain-containing protein [Actinoplanes sp. NPDC026623]|uniref:GAF and ANTAR domain-containing protein n=1 Tax=Actinoplanes sp. NPDC026623 TaxID=3155610 RepID=UPI0033ED20FA